jgi:shikimate kinase
VSPRVVIVGMPASGKSTVGREVAAALGIPFRDADDVLEARSGKLIREIFSDDGEEAFRAIEEDVVLESLRADDCVVSLGGGAVLSPTIRAALVGLPVVWLEVGVATATRRAGLNQLRPLLLGDVRARMETLLAERRHLYEEVATIRLSTDRTSTTDLASQIVAALEESAR